MPVTKTAKRALKSSKRKEEMNKSSMKLVEIAIRTAKKSMKTADIRKAISLVDRASKKGIFHKNKAARIKSVLAKISPKKKKDTSKK